MSRLDCGLRSHGSGGGFVERSEPWEQLGRENMISVHEYNPTRNYCLLYHELSSPFFRFIDKVPCVAAHVIGDSLCPPDVPHKKFEITLPEK